MLFASLSGALLGPDLIVLCRSETPQLFTVLPEKRTATVGGAMMGSTHIYDMSTVSTFGGWERGRKQSLLSLSVDDKIDPFARL